MPKKNTAISSLTLVCLICPGLVLGPVAAAQSTSSLPDAGASTNSDSNSAYGNLGYGNYPRVTQLEQQLLGKTYVSEPLPTRVSRLEMKQFGKVTPGDDYGDRIDRLDQAVPTSPTTADNDTADAQSSAAAATNSANGTASYAPVPAPSIGIPVAPSFVRAVGAPGVGGGAAGSSASAYVSTTGSSASQQEQAASGDYGRYPRVSALEQKVFGLTYEKDSLPVRIARLEEKEFGKASPDDDYGERIDRLDRKVKPKMEVAQDDQGSGAAGANGGGAGRGSMSGTIGRTLVGLLGSAVGIGGGGIGGVGGTGSGMGMLGMGRGMGMGPGLMGSGIGYGVDPSGQRGKGNGQSQADSASAPSAPMIQNPFAPGSLPATGIEDRTNAMEKFVFGREHSDRPLEERVARLEKKLAPWEHHEGSQDLAARVNHLWSILAAANGKQTKSAVAGKQDLTH